MATIGPILLTLIWVAFIVLLARLIIDWVQVLARTWRPRGLVAVLCEGVYTLTDPPLRAVRGIIPPIRMGGAMLDLSPMILLIGLSIVQYIVERSMA